MSIDFDWEISEDELGSQFEQKPPRKKPLLKWFGRILPLLLIAVAGGFIYQRLNDSERQLRQSVTDVLDLKESAYLAGDGELFFSFYEEANEAHRFSQLLPENQAFHRAPQTVTKAEIHNNIIWANIVATTPTGDIQRIGFFEQTPAGLRHLETDINYWGEVQDERNAWGVLRLHETDAVWSADFTAAVSATIEDKGLQRAINALDLPLAVIIRDDFVVSTLENVLHFPSPRLLGLDSEGQPTEAYWQGLADLLTAHLSPITIRFGLPSEIKNDPTMLDMYRGFSAEFAAQYAPGRVTVEIVTASELSQDPLEWLAAVDTALHFPSEALLKTGAVYDLTALVNSDSGFDTGDFYTQPWRAGWWHNRMWLVPWTSGINLLYYDVDNFAELGLPTPTAASTWAELDNMLTQLEQPAVLDPTGDLLYAYALSQDKRCTTDDCSQRLTKAGVEAALRWYQQQVETNRFLPIANYEASDRRQFVQDSLSVNKNVSLWLDAPLRFEYQRQLQTTSVLPMPAFSAETPPVSPVHVNGFIMSQATQSPYWSWQWLKFLSYQEPMPSQRDIPARPSATRQSRYWEWQRAPLADALRLATTHAHPILIGDERYFSWAQLDGLLSGEMSLEESAEPLSTKWFAPNSP